MIKHQVIIVDNSSIESIELSSYEIIQSIEEGNMTTISFENINKINNIEISILFDQCFNKFVDVEEFENKFIIYDPKCIGVEELIKFNFNYIKKYVRSRRTNKR